MEDPDPAEGKRQGIEVKNRGKKTERKRKACGM
jgi:hypothetical protein